MTVKCKCGAYIDLRDDKCGECGRPILSKNTSEQRPFLAPCEKCGGNGRLIKKIESGKDVFYYKCFDCVQKEQAEERERRYAANPSCISDKNRAFGTARELEYWTKEEAAYQRAIIEHHLKPLFYGRSPNTKELQRAADRMNGIVQLKEMKTVDVDEDDIPF